MYKKRFKITGKPESVERLAERLGISRKTFNGIEKMVKNLVDKELKKEKK